MRAVHQGEREELLPLDLDGVSDGTSFATATVKAGCRHGGREFTAADVTTVTEAL